MPRKRVKITKLPPESKDWDEETCKLASELIGVGIRWQEVLIEREQLGDRRRALFEALEQRGLQQKQMAKLASTSPGSVEQALILTRKKKKGKK